MNETFLKMQRDADNKVQLMVRDLKAARSRDENVNFNTK